MQMLALPHLMARSLQKARVYGYAQFLASAPDGEVYTRIDPFTPLMIIGRSGDSTWLEVRTPDGVQGLGLGKLCPCVN